MKVAEDTKTVMRRVFAGASVTLDHGLYSLHDLTQIAVTLQPHATLAIRNAELMSPIEKASVQSASRGRIIFV